MKLRTKTATQFTTRLLRRSTTVRPMGLLAVWLLALGGCTKDPVEHLKPGDERPQESTKPDKTTSGKTDKDSGASANDGQDANVSTPVVFDASAGEQDAAEVSTDVDASADGGPTTPQETIIQRIDATIRRECGAAPVDEGEFSRKALRAAAADCAIWHYCAFDVIAQELDQAVSAYHKDPNQTTLQQARETWRLAMLDWSRSELFQFGPAGSLSQSAGKDPYEGRGIRDLIYAWPSTSACRVDEQLITQNYDSRGMSSVLISGRGLFALEYLLFSSAEDSACVPSSSTAVEWAKLSESALAKRKREYAKAVATDIAAQSRSVIDMWDPDGGNFKATLVDAKGKYPDEQEAMQTIAWSLIYAEREVKDWKIGIPAGYTLTSPVSGPETPYANLGIEAIRANLRGFRSLFQGCGESGEGLGFDDWLIEAGHPELAQDVIAAWERAHDTAMDFEASLGENSAELETLHQVIRGLTTLLKSDLFGAGSPLNLKLPGGVEGDTD